MAQEEKHDKDGSVQEGPDLNPSRSPLDQKLYRQLLLSNGLRVVLVSDTVAMAQSYNDGNGGIPYDNESDSESEEETKEKDKAGAADDDEAGSGDEEEDDGGGGLRSAAAAMVVGVGSMYDPPDCQGLAHFLEHLLFMGSAKYPEENAYDNFMSKHGGSNNAYTEMEHTVYHFDIPQEQLVQALDMFAGFFTNPLMSEDSVERELKAIESEFQLVKNSDGSRLQQLMSHTCGYELGDHPFAKFDWGNLFSLKEQPAALGVDVLARMKGFYKEHYHAANMRLVVVGGYPLDVLQAKVLDSFSDVPPKQAGQVVSWNDSYNSPMRSEGMPFQPSSLQKVYYTAPVKDRHSLVLTWQIPSQFDNWKSKPCDYLGHLIGHEAKGSLLAAIKSQTWATACCAGVGSEGYERASSHALFAVSFTLSEEGVEHWQEIVARTYQYIGMLRHHCNEGLPLWIYEELKSIQEMTYRYDDEPSPEDLVEAFAEEMAPAESIPSERLLDGSSLLFSYEPEQVKQLLDGFLLPANCRIDVSSTLFGRSVDFENSDTSPKGTVVPASDAQLGLPMREPYFGTSYWCQDLSKEVFSKWVAMAEPQLPPKHSMLALPPRNNFIPTKYDLRPLSPADCDHPLLNSSIKLQITVGKKKQWFPATVTQFDSLKNRILLSYEDEDEKWHKFDAPSSELTPAVLTAPDFEGTLDDKKIKYRMVALAVEGQGAVRRYGDESDFDVEDGTSFPAIPPAALPNRLPRLVVNTSTLKMWHLQDRTFKRPIADLRLHVHCADANQTPLHTACADLLVDLICDALTEVAYMASVCELGSSLSRSDGGFSMRVHGFDDKLLDLFNPMFDLLMSFRCEEEKGDTPPLPSGIKPGRFDMILETYRRSCANSGFKSSNLSTNIRVGCVRESSWSANQKLKSIANITPALFMRTTRSILTQIGVECLYHGNVDASDVQAAKTSILTRLEQTSMLTADGKEQVPVGLPKKKYPSNLVLQVPLQEHPSVVSCPSKDVADPNTATEVYIQIGKDNIRDRCLGDLLAELLDEPLYDQVRTKDQFGYSVGCDARWTYGVIGFYLYVISSCKTAAQSVQRLEDFLTTFRQTLVDMSQDDFMAHLVGLATRKLEMFNSLSEETGHYWSEIRNGRFQFEVWRDEVVCLKTMTKADALEAFDEWLAPNKNKRRRLVVQVIACTGDASEGRPQVKPEDVSDYNDECVHDFRMSCKKQTFGKIY